MKDSKGPQFLRFFIPIIEVLKDLGGSGTATEVTDLVIEKLNITENEQQETLKNGVSRVRNQVAWARSYLVKSGFIDSSQRGIWTLTQKGMTANLTHQNVLEHFKTVQFRFTKLYKQKKQKDKINNKIADESEPELVDFSDYKTDLLNLLKSLSPDVFERICKRLLRKAGFHQVVVTGRSGDGGIDGHEFYK